LSPKPTLRQLWTSGAPTLGGWCSIPSSYAAEIVAASFDWVCIDMQHGLAGQETMVTMLQSLAITSTPAFVRVSWNRPGEIMRALDAGAQGVIVPMIGSAAEARAAVGACRYAPDGYRSWGPSRNALYASRLDPAEINRQVICTVMVETIEAIEAIDEILEVPGVDAVFIGPSDLAVAMGIDPSRAFENADHEKLVRHVLMACRKRLVVAGMFCGGSEQAIRWRDAGFTMLALQTDARLLRSATEAIVRSVRETPKAEPPESSPSYV
jgi:4-hydroxy-2-oxoheptanedioate aldolase